MNKRLSILMSREHLTNSGFADILGVQPSVISHLLSGRNNPSYDFIAKLLKAFPAYNADWLILGQGEMIKSGDTDAIEHTGETAQLLFQDATPQLASKKNNDSSIVVDEHPNNRIEDYDINQPREIKSEDKSQRIIILFPDNTFEEYTRRR